MKRPLPIRHRLLLARLEKEHAKAHRLWKATRKPSAWVKLRNITTAILKASAA